MKRPVIALTAGDVAGIGPEILIRALSSAAVGAACRPLVICHPAVLVRATALCDDIAPCKIVCLDRLPSHPADPIPAGDASGTVLCFNPAGDGAELAARRAVSAAAGDAAFRYLSAAIDMARTGIVDAIATAPLNKAALHAAGHHYPGHTEILAEQCGVSDFAMMLHLSESRIAPLREFVRTGGYVSAPAGHGLSIAHVTLHTSVARVPEQLTTKGVVEKVRLMQEFLHRIGCERQAIGICALNPHGGEGGLFGDEESRVIAPALSRFQGVDDHVDGPLPADTLIRRAVAGEFDGVIAMYHDQGHIPIKLIGFDAAVNITLGLPIVRTSPTHGTAFDRAWNRATPADPSGMVEAILTAATLCRQL